MTKLLPALFKIDPEAAESMVDANPLARAQARILPVIQEAHFADPVNIDTERCSSLYDQIKQMAKNKRNWERKTGLAFDLNLSAEQHWNAQPPIFEQRLNAWVAEAGPNENRQEAANRIQKVYNGGESYSRYTCLDLTGLGLSTIPEVVGALKNLTRIYIDNNAVLHKPEAFRYALRNVTLALIKESPYFFEHDHPDNKIYPVPIFEALQKNPAVLKLLPPTMREDKRFLEEMSQAGIGILPYVPEALKSDIYFMRRLVDVFSFGSSRWQQFLGDVGEVPPIPFEMINILCGDDPYDTHEPRKKVAENFILFFRPKTINGEPFTLNNLKNQALKNRGWNKVEKFDISPKIATELDAKSSEEGGEWVLMRKDVIPGSRNRSFTEQQALVNNQPGYRVPDMVSVFVGALVHYERTGECLFSRDPWTFTLCAEVIGGNQTFVGGLTPGRFYLGYDSGSINNDDFGIVAMRKFPSVPEGPAE